jgi:hypothetical protein
MLCTSVDLGQSRHVTFLEVSPCMSKRGGALFLLFRHLAHPARSAAVVQPNCARVFSRFALTFPFP